MNTGYTQRVIQDSVRDRVGLRVKLLRYQWRKSKINGEAELSWTGSISPHFPRTPAAQHGGASPKGSPGLARGT